MITSNKPRIIGVAGTLGSGKDTVGDLLARKYKFFHASTSDMLRAAKRKAYGDSPKALLLRNDPFANRLRAEKGSGILVQLAYDEFIKNESRYSGGLVATAIRSIGEAEKIKELGGILVFVDADPKIRYERVDSRKRDANEHNATFEEFMALEKSESDVPADDKTIQNLPAMKAMADLQLENNGNSVDAFQRAVEQALGLAN